MKGKISYIGINNRDMEFGFIESGDESFYFDDRFLEDGVMEDYYEGDVVQFTPGTPTTDGRNRIAYKITLFEEAPEETKNTDKKEQPPANAVEYIEPERNPKEKWFTTGRSKRLQIIGFSEEENIILNRLMTVFYHTNAGHFSTRNKDVSYGYSLFGPTKQYVLQLGMEKVEFAMIMCDKADFQRRTLDETFFYLTNRVIPKVRISGHFYVLATKYEKIVEQIKSPEIQGALPYSVIPFSYKELLETPTEQFESFVMARFKDFLFERNFFSYAEPIKDRLFLFGGREAYAKEIADRSVSGEHSGIFGPRKSGKTSVINMINQELDQRDVFHLSYRCIEFARHKWNDAVSKIISDIYQKLEVSPPNHEYTETTAIEYFSKDLLQVLDKTGGHIVLIFDEIEQITVNSTFDETWQDPIAFHLFWSSIITFCEKNPGVLSLIIAGINPSISEVDILPTSSNAIPPRNPIYKKLANQNYLTPFVFKQTRRMVNELGKYMGFEFDDEVCFELQKDFGGHPFFTRQMCKLIVAHVRTRNLKTNSYEKYCVTRPLYNAIKETGEYAVESIGWCKDIIRELSLCYPNEYKLLLNIANGDVKTLNDVRMNVSIIPHLIGYGLVRFDRACNEMEISIDVVKAYLVAQKEYKKPFDEMTIEEIDEEIQEGISVCEPAIRKLIKDVITAQLLPGEAKEFIAKTSSYKKANGIKDLDNYTIDDLLNPRISIIHFYNLRDIICQNDTHFNFFKIKLHPYTRQEINTFMSNMYIARNAADHHYEVHSEGVLEGFRASRNEMLKILKTAGYVE